MSPVPEDSPSTEPHAGLGETAIELKSRTAHGGGSQDDEASGFGDGPGTPPTLPEPGLVPSHASNDGSITYPDGGFRAWIVVFGAAVNLAATFGLMTAVGLFQVNWKKNQLKGYSATDIAWIISVFGFLEILLAGPAGTLFDRFGAQKLLFPAAATYTASFLGLAFGTKYEHFMGCFIVAGVSAAVITTVSIAVINHWFDKRKGLAMGLATMGSGVGGIFFSVTLKPIFHKLPWKIGIVTLSLVVLVLVTVGTFCIRARIGPRQDKFYDLSCFKSLKFLLTTFAVSGFELVLFAGWGYLPTYSEGAKTGDMFNMMLALNIGSTLGRLIPGYLADKLGSFNVTSFMALATMVTMLAIWLPFGENSEVALYVASVCLGFGTGSFVATSAACLGHLSDVRDSGKYLGSCYTVVSFATLASNPACQAVLKDFDSAAVVWFLSGVLASALVSILVVRWAVLGYQWKWMVKV